MKALKGWRKVYETPKGFTVYKNTKIVVGMQSFGAKEIRLANPKITNSRTPGGRSKGWSVTYVEHSYSAPGNYWHFDTKAEAEEKVRKLMKTK